MSSGSSPATGPGGGGGGASGDEVSFVAESAGGGGEYAQEPALAVTHAAGVNYTVGGAGAGGNNAAGQGSGGAGFAGQVRVTYSTGAPPIMFSIAQAGGTDQFGTAYSAGINTNQKITTSGGLAVTGGSTTDTLTVTSTATLDSTAVLLGTDRIAVSTSEYATIGPNNSSPAITSAAGGAAVGLAGNLGIFPAADFTHFTVTGTGFAQCTKAWSIPANDPQVGTTYRITYSGLATQGTSAEKLAFQFSTGAGVCTLPAGGLAANIAIAWSVVMEVTVITTGSGGTANFACRAMASQVNNTTTNDCTAVGFSQASAFNTTSAFTLEGQALWGSASVGCTMTCYQSFIERLGP